MWLLASFHVHANPLDCNGVANERHSSELDGDDCLLCQFQQLAYEETPQVAVIVVQPELEVNAVPYIVDEQSIFEPHFLSRAPPVLL